MLAILLSKGEVSDETDGGPPLEGVKNMTFELWLLVGMGMLGPNDEGGSSCSGLGT